jgi:hypothetical protein
VIGLGRGLAAVALEGGAGVGVGCSLPLFLSTIDVSAGHIFIIERMLTASKGTLHLETLAVFAHVADGCGVARATNPDAFGAWDGIGDDLLGVGVLAH